jgi:hypothetical protein
VARALLDQMLRELLGSSLPVSFSNVQLEHQEALQHADAGDLNPLVELVQALVRG